MVDTEQYLDPVGGITVRTWEPTYGSSGATLVIFQDSMVLASGGVVTVLESDLGEYVDLWSQISRVVVSSDLADEIFKFIFNGHPPDTNLARGRSFEFTFHGLIQMIVQTTSPGYTAVARAITNGFLDDMEKAANAWFDEHLDENTNAYNVRILAELDDF